MTAEYQVHGDVAVITLNNPPVNGLGLATRQGIVDALAKAEDDAAVKAVVITGAGKAFSGGADIKEFGKPTSLQDPNLHSVIRTLENFSKPVVAATKPETRPAPKPAAPKPEAAKPAVPERSVTTVSTAPAASSVGFAVQLGAFAHPADAIALRDKVRAAGFSAFTEQVRTDNGVLNRVRVGPVANRAAAEQLKTQVAAKIGIAGMVRPHP